MFHSNAIGSPSSPPAVSGVKMYAMRGKEGNCAERTKERVGASPQRVEAGDEEAGDDQRPQGPELLRELREEPVRPDLEVVPVVSNREPGAELERPLGSGQAEGPEGRVRNRIADDDEVLAGTSSPRREASGSPKSRGRPQRMPRRGDDESRRA